MTWRLREDAADLIPIVVVLLALFPLYNNDLWWHLAAGRWMVANYDVPRTDVFSWTRYLGDWVDNEWLGEVLVFGLWRVGGLAALIAARAALYATLTLLVRAYTRVLNAPEAFVPSVITAVALSHHWWTLRPSVFSLIALLVMLLAIEAERERFLPLLFVVWANVHPGFLFGLVVLTGMACVHRRLRFVVPLCALATLVNPYGWRVYEQQLRIAQDPTYRALIDEWVRPPATFLVLGAGYALCALISIYRVPWYRLVPLLATVVLAMTAVRFEEYAAWIAAPIVFTLPIVREAKGWRSPVPYLVLAAIGVGWLPPVANEAVAATPHYAAIVFRQHIASLVMAVFLLASQPRRHSLQLVIATVVALAITVPQLSTLVEPGRYPTKCLEQLSPYARYFHRLSWGGWLIWSGYPSFIDGRCSGQALFLYWMAADQKSASTLLDEWKIDYVLAGPEDGVVPQLKELPAWKLVCQDEASMLFSRSNRPR